jgi:hypothetical protein
MPIDPLTIAIRGTTQDHLPIEDVIDDLVLLKSGECAAIMQVSSVNFDLLSEREQQAMVFAYGGILNSLNFPIQIVIYSNTKDVSFYLANLKIAEEKQNNSLLRSRIESYRKFIEETVKKNDVLSKAFYVVVPFSILELGMKSAPSSIAGAFKLPMGNNKVTSLPFEKNYIIDKAKASLKPKKDHIIRLFARLGLEAKALNTKEIIELLYKIYNEDTASNQKLQTLNYDAPVVTAKI